MCRGLLRCLWLLLLAFVLLSFGIVLGSAKKRPRP